MSDPARILIVDDEPFNVDYLEQELQDLGYRTEAAFNGREALERVAASPPDLVLLDILMPEIDGFTVCKMLKEDPDTELIPIIIMTALNSTEDRIRGIEAGADDFLSKPVDERELVARITTALRSRRAVQQRVAELNSAQERLKRMGTRDEDVAVVRVELLTATEAPVTQAPVTEAPSSGADMGAATQAPVTQAPATDAPSSGADMGAATQAPVTQAPSSGALSELIASRYLDRIEEEATAVRAETAQRTATGITAVLEGDDPQRRRGVALELGLAILDVVSELNEHQSVQSVTATVGVAAGSATIGSQRTVVDDVARWDFVVSGPAADLARRAAATAPAATVLVDPETVSRVEGLYEFTPHPSGFFAAGTTSADAGAGSHSTGLSWPAAFNALGEHIKKDWAIEDLLIHRSLGGKSGALVFAVDITCDGFTGQAILKLESESDPHWNQQAEADRHRRALAATPTYSEHHLPRIVHTSRSDGKLATLVTIAARGLEYTLPWSLCPYERQLQIARTLSGDLLAEWNGDYSLSPDLITAPALLASWLDYRLSPAEGGRIHGYLDDQLGVDPATTSFSVDGVWYPNPLALAVGDDHPGDQVSLRGVVGRIHGDLHGLNVLVRPGESSEYYLIDLAFYDDAAYLFYDHAYFELSHVLQVREHVAPSQFLHVVEASAGRVSPRSDDVGLIALVEGIRAPVEDWIEAEEPNRLSYLESQAMLARVAVGLNFVHKRVPDDYKARALLYAMAAAKSYLAFHGVEWPRDGVPLRFDA